MKTTYQQIRGGDISRSYLRNAPVPDHITLLAAEIVIAAVRDWRELVEKKAWLDPLYDKYCNFNELREFFHSEWCEFLLMNFCVDKTRIIDVLEKELEQAKMEHNKIMGDTDERI